MRWTAENKEILFKVLFETQDLHIDLDKMVDAWPGDEKPTAKALSEQLYKYKGKGQGSVTLTRAKAGASESAGKKRSPKKLAVKNEVTESNDAFGEGPITPSTPTKRPAPDSTGTPKKRRSPKKLVKESDVVEATDDA